MMNISYHKSNTNFIRFHNLLFTYISQKHNLKLFQSFVNEFFMHFLNLDRKQTTNLSENVLITNFVIYRQFELKFSIEMWSKRD